MKIFLPAETISLVKQKYLFLDTCLLIDLIFLHKKDQSLFLSGLDQFIKNGCVLVTVEPVIVEFLLGSNEKSLKVKNEYLKLLEITGIPVRTIDEKIEELILEYGEGARGSLSYTDICLGAAIKQFPNKSLVLTRNYKDFPARIFDCSAVFSISLDKEVRTYCFYGYKPNKNDKSAKKNEGEIPF